MEHKQVSRREFLQTASVAGVATFAAGTILTASAVTKAPAAKAAAPAPATAAPTAAKKGIFICGVCGHVQFGSAPDFCPLCHAAKTSFTQDDALFTDTETKFTELAPKHAPIVTASKKSALVTEEPSIDVQVRIGKVLHPSTGEHYIRFIDCYIDDVYTARMILTTKNHPVAGFNIKAPGKSVRIVAMCNLHGHWQAEVTPA